MTDIFRHGFPPFLLAAVLSLSLAACNSNTSDLQAFVAKVKSRKPPPVKPIPAHRTYTPFVYNPDGRRSPFVLPGNEAKDKDSGGGIHPNLNRPLGPLEHFPLDSLQMVGTITAGGVTYGLIQAPDGILYRVSRGDHMGRHYGKIDAISDAGIILTEIVPDGSGGYRKRQAALHPPK